MIVMVDRRSVAVAVMLTTTAMGELMILTLTECSGICPHSRTPLGRPILITATVPSTMIMITWPPVVMTTTRVSRTS